MDLVRAEEKLRLYMSGYGKVRHSLPSELDESATLPHGKDHVKEDLGNKATQSLSCPASLACFKTRRHESIGEEDGPRRKVQYLRRQRKRMQCHVTNTFSWPSNIVASDASIHGINAPPTNSPSSTPAEELRNIVDEFEQELADINRLGRSIDELSVSPRDGCRPGELKLSLSPNMSRAWKQRIPSPESPCLQRFDPLPPEQVPIPILTTLKSYFVL
eukprot:m.97016 g.97016  ORF g.97016 m.97016 type:complete len:217 (-) comp13573_c0_seq1:79-729(-)